MNIKSSPTESDAIFQRAWVAALSDEQIDSRIQIISLGNAFEDYTNYADVMMKYATRKIKSLFRSKGDHVTRKALKR